ncbi:ATP-grasp domain-containing protein [Demequina pelophila]|uniref:ATP-grasp domain-containing protein n=1 Tax=Demequina pelophila TaxID=1638984 RepID=UPI000780DBC7|nr:hypothetical protein [Demequina pelophila]
MRIALVTTRELPVPDADEDLLLPHLPEATLVAWEDPDVDWAGFDAAFIRSTWNYQDHRDDFLAWARAVELTTALHNRHATLAWNTDKRYLADLAAAGVPTVPTAFVAPGERAGDDALAGHVVVKPSVGAGSNGARLLRDDPAGAAAHVAALHARGLTAMIQPYLHEVDEHGESALIFVGGALSHTARKAAILSRDMSWATGLYADEKIAPAAATPAERDVAARVLEAAARLGHDDLAYARVDLLPTPDGPVLLELELAEPSLFLGLDPEAPARAAAAFRARAARG